jgi:hypothetical protein
MERVNTAASLAGWSARLEWTGIHVPAPNALPEPSPSLEASRIGPPGSAQESGLNQTLWNLLRRFVDPQWCEARGWKPPE